MGLFTLPDCSVSCYMDYKKSRLKFESYLPIPEFFGSYCNLTIVFLIYSFIEPHCIFVLYWKFWVKMYSVHVHCAIYTYYTMFS